MNIPPWPEGCDNSEVDLYDERSTVLGWICFAIIAGFWMFVMSFGG